MLAALFVLSAACTNPPGSRTARSGPGATASPPGPRSRHVVLIVMENHEYSSIIDSPEAPYLNGLAGRYGLATQYFANAHPSLPNYLDLMAGSDFGIHDDGESYVLQGQSLVDQLEADGLTWRAYMDGMPANGPCTFPSGGDGYAKKHDPFAYFADIQEDAARCRNVVPYSRFAPDLSAGPPNFTWIAPNLCHDMHDCSIAMGDAWLADNVPPILQRLTGRDLLFVVFDEGTTDEGGGGHAVCIVAGPGAKPHATAATPYNHFSLLRTVEDVFELGHLGHAADPGVQAMDSLLR